MFLPSLTFNYIFNRGLRFINKLYLTIISFVLHLQIRVISNPLQPFQIMRLIRLIAIILLAAVTGKLTIKLSEILLLLRRVLRDYYNLLCYEFVGLRKKCDSCTILMSNLILICKRNFQTQFILFYLFFLFCSY